jgi:hypothetical protein
MKLRVEPGGWYGDCDAKGNYVSLHRDSHLIINGNRIELPIVNGVKDNILQLVMKEWNGQILIAGQSHQGLGNYLYKDGKWKIVSPSFATWPCAFSSNSLYLVSGPNQYIVYDLLTGLTTAPISRKIGVNGIRYINFDQSVDGIVTGDETYGSKILKMAQWIKNNQLYVGQSYIDGCILLDDIAKVYHLVDHGDCEFIRFYQDGNLLAVTIVKPQIPSTSFYWFNTSEINEFAVVSQDVVPDNPTKPTTPTQPNPGPSPSPIPNTPISKPANPVPTSPFRKLQTMNTNTERGGLVGPKGLFARIDPNELGKGLFGWYPIHFDAPDSNGNSEFELTDLGNGRFTVRHINSNAWYGADLTQYSDDIGKEFYGKPNEEGAGPYEMPYGFGPLPDTGMLILMIQYSPDSGKPFCSTPVTWVKK